jgi:hypothetical protein
LASFYRYLFSYVPSEFPPEVPQEEPEDPNANRALADAYRNARWTLVAVCALGVAWATAQFSLAELDFAAAGISVDLRNAPVPLLLAIAVIYLAMRCVMEYAMMERHVRRWPLAKLDMSAVLLLARLTVLIIAAGALNRSLRSVVVVAVSLGIMALIAGVLGPALMVVFMPVRVAARRRAGRESAANALGEALVWGGVLGVVLTVVGAIAFAIASYQSETIRRFVWPDPPSPVVLAAFVFALCAGFLSYWLLRPLKHRLFAELPGYYTELVDGRLHLHTVNRQKEPLL